MNNCARLLLQKTKSDPLDSPAYQAALARGEVSAMGMYTGRFDQNAPKDATSKQQYPDSRTLATTVRSPRPIFPCRSTKPW